MSLESLKTTVDDNFLSLVKTSLRLDESNDDLLLKSLIKTSRTDIISQVGERIDGFFDNNDRFDTAVIIETSHLYEHRDAVSTQQYYETPMALYSLINSLKDDYRCEVEKLDQGGGNDNGQKP